MNLPETEETVSVSARQCVRARAAMCVLIPFSLFLDADYSKAYIGHGDQAEVAQCARNIAEGRGPVVDCVWLLHGPHVPVTHGIRYWSLYVSWWVAPFFCFFGASRGSALLAASVAKAVMAVGGFAFVRRWTGQPFIAIAFSVALLFDPTWVNHVNILSDLYLAVAALLFLFSVVLWVQSNSLIWATLSGLLAGLAIGVKPTGLLFTVIPLAALIVRPPSLRLFQQFLAYAISIGLGVSVLAVHNWREAETLWWPDAPTVAAAARARVVDGGESGFHDAGFYNPTIQVDSIPSSARIKRALQTLRSFTNYLVRGLILGPAWLPFVGILLIGLVKSVKERDVRQLRRPLPIVIFAISALALPLCWLVHMESRYWLFIAAPIVCLCFCELQGRLRQGLVVAAILGFLITADVQLVRNLRYYTGRLDDNDDPVMESYRDLEPYLTNPDEVVLTSSPWQFTFHTRIRSVMLPACDDPDVMRDVAQRYGARRVVITQHDHRSHLYDDLAAGRSNESIECLAANENFAIGRIRLNSEPGQSDRQ